MAIEYTLWMQKTKTGSAVKDSLGSFGFAIVEFKWGNDETQDVASRSWAGIHGEEVYIPPTGLKLKAYDVEVELCYKGAIGTINSAYKSLRNYLTGIDGSGGELIIYDPYWKRGKAGVYLKKISDLNPFRSSANEGITCKITFHVSNPISEVVAGTNSSGKITGLGVA